MTIDPTRSNHNEPLAREYFAFVEALDGWEMSFDQPEGGDDDPPWLSQLLQIRADRNFQKHPSHAVWLDCVGAEYFEALPWRDEECEIGNRVQAARRRERILSLDASQFRVVLLLVSPKDPGGDVLGNFADTSWHRVMLGGGGFPVISAVDYEFGPGEPIQNTLLYEAQCTNDERARLYHVFNFNFLPDADLGRLTERGPPTMPPHSPVNFGYRYTIQQARSQQQSS